MTNEEIYVKGLAKGLGLTDIDKMKMKKETSLPAL